MRINFYSRTSYLKVPFFTLIFFFFYQAAFSQVAPAKRWDRTYGGDGADINPLLIHTIDGGYLIGSTSSSGNTGDRSDPNRDVNFQSYDYWIIKTDGNGNKLWDKAYGGDYDDILEDVQQTPDGGYILGGYTWSRKSGDITGSTYGDPDYWIVRLDAAGNKLWDRVFSSYGNNYFSSLVQTSDGGFLLGGYSDGTYIHRQSPTKGLMDYWILKLDQGGKVLWEKSFGGSKSDQLQKIVPTSEGNFLLCGYSASGMSGDKSQPNYGETDYWVVKIDPAGTKLWDKSFGGSDYDMLYSASATADGGYILVGNQNPDLLGKNSKCKVVKIDAAGGKQWEKSFSGSGYEELQEVLPLGDGYLLAGSSDSEFSGDRSYPLQGGKDFWIIKTNLSGALVWERTLGSSTFDRLNTIIKDKEGGYILAGYTTNTAPSGHKTQTSHGMSDIWLVKLDEEGTSSISQSPAIAPGAGETAFTEGFNTASTPVTIDGGLVLDDPDNATLYSAAVRITAGHQPTEDVLYFSGSPEVTGNISGRFVSSSGVLYLLSEGATATLAQWQAALRAVAYNNSSESPNQLPRTISFSIHDGDAMSMPSFKTVSVTAVNDTPTSLTLSKQVIAENVLAGTLVGTFASTDPDSKEQFTYILVPGEGDADNSAFLIEGNTLKINFSPDYELQASYQVRAAVRDAGGLAYEKAFLITVTDVDEIPPVGSFTINYGDAYTNNPYLTLALNKGDATSIRISEDGITWGSWYKVYNNSTNYYLRSLEDGVRTLYIALRDEAGNVSEVYTDQIILDQTKPLPVFTTTSTSPTAAYPFEISINFDEPVIGFDQSDVVVSGGIIDGFSGSDQHFTLLVMPTVKGTVTINVPAGKMKDRAENLNRAAVPLALVYEGILRPVVSTTPVTGIKPASAIVGGEVLTDGGAPVLERGILLSTGLEILIPATKIVAGSGTGGYSINLEDLSPGTTYYVEAYATNVAGTTYGEEFTFTTPKDPYMLQEITKGIYDRSPTNAATVTFRLNFNKSVRDLKASNLRLATTGLTGAAIQGITGSGSLYYVTVKAGTGKGTLRLVMDNDLGMTFGISNLPFTSGMEYNIDTDPPLVTGVTPNGIYNTDRVITFDEGTATLKLATNSTDTPFASGTTVSAHGNYLFKVTDEAGNITSFYFYIDKVPPYVTGVTDGMTYTRDVVIDLKGNTATLNGEPYTSLTPVTEDGNYTLEVKEASGNTLTVRFKIDKTPPTGKLALTNGTGFTNSVKTNLAIEASGATSMLLYNEGQQSTTAWQPVTSLVEWILPDGDGEKKIFLQLRDEAGSLSPLYETTVILDQLAPSVTLSSPSPQAEGAPIQIEIVFSEPVKGFTIDDIVVTGAPKGNFSGDGARYMLELQASQTHYIQVQVSAGVATDMAGNGNNAASPFSLRNVTGVDDLEQHASLQVYPNPVQTSGQLYIRLDGGRGKMLQLKLYDNLGQLLMERSCPISGGTPTEYGIPLHGLAKGVYYLYVSDAKARSVKKVVVQ